MGDSGEFSARPAWPRGRAGVLAGLVVGGLLATGVVGGASAAALDARSDAAPRTEATAPTAAGASDAPLVPGSTPTPEPSDPATDPPDAPADPAPPPPIKTDEQVPETPQGSRPPAAAPAPAPVPAPAPPPPPAPAPPPPPPAPAATASGDVLSLTNAQRSAAGVAALGSSPTLVSMACDWASQMAGGVGLVHNNARPGGAHAWAENIAAGYGSASAVVDGWMHSDGHRANILNGAYTQMGACSADAADGTRYWVQKFAG